MKFFLNAIIVLLLVSGCSEEKADPVLRSSSKKAESGNRDYEITTFGTNKISVKEALKRYLPAKYRGRHNQPDAVLAAVKKAIKQLDFEMAVKLATYAIKLDPRKGEAYFLRGKSSYNSIGGSQKAAYQDFEKAVELGYDDGRVYEYMARIHSDAKETEKAIALLSKAIQRDPYERDYYRYRASMYADLKQFDKAEADFVKHVEVAPAKVGGYLDRARFFESLGKNRKALKDYDQIVKLTENIKTPGSEYEKRALAIRGKAHLYYKLEEYDKALEALNELLKFGASGDEAYKLRGDVYVRLKRYDDAVKDYTSSIEISPRFATNSYAARAEAYELLGQDELASKDRTKVKELKAAPAERPLFDMKK